MTDADALRFERGLPSTERYGVTNTNISAASREVARNAQDRVAFYEMYGRATGNLLGARSQWNEYLQRNPIYDADGNIRANRPDFEQWMRSGAPDARTQTRTTATTQRAAPAPASQSGITPEQARAELLRRDALRRRNGVSGQQPGGYTGR